MDDDALTLLQQDHEKMARLLARIAMSDDVGRTLLLCGTLADEVAVHTEVEEAVLFPFLRRHVPAGEELVSLIRGLNDATRAALVRLQGAEPTSPEFLDALAAVRRAVRRHIAQEERQVLPRIRSAMNPAGLAVLGARLHGARRG